MKHNALQDVLELLIMTAYGSWCPERLRPDFRVMAIKLDRMLASTDKALESLSISMGEDMRQYSPDEAILKAAERIQYYEDFLNQINERLSKVADKLDIIAEKSK